MSEITTLFTQYSVEELILLIVVILFAVKALSELFNYLYNKIKNHFGVISKKEEWEKNVMDCLQQITQEIQVLKQQNQETHEHQKQIDETVALIQERLQENTRSSWVVLLMLLSNC